MNGNLYGTLVGINVLFVRLMDPSLYLRTPKPRKMKVLGPEIMGYNLSKMKET